MPSAAVKRAEAGANAQRDRIVMEHLPLVRSIASRIRETLPVHVELDDVIHAGVLGLIDAASKFDPEKAVAFPSYAKHRIRGAILDSLRQEDPVSRDLRRSCRQIEAATRDLAAEMHRQPSEAEIAERLSMGLEQLQAIKLRLRTVGTVSASGATADGDESLVPELPSAPATQPDNLFAQEQLRGALGRAMQCLPPRYQRVMALYYTEQLTMKEIGQTMGINESRVSQIHKCALEKMEVVLQASGISSSQAFYA